MRIADHARLTHNIIIGLTKYEDRNALLVEIADIPEARRAPFHVTAFVRHHDILYPYAIMVYIDAHDRYLSPTTPIDADHHHSRLLGDPTTPFAEDTITPLDATQPQPVIDPHTPLSPPDEYHWEPVCATLNVPFVHNDDTIGHHRHVQIIAQQNLHEAWPRVHPQLAAAQRNLLNLENRSDELYMARHTLQLETAYLQHIDDHIMAHPGNASSTHTDDTEVHRPSHHRLLEYHDEAEYRQHPQHQELDTTFLDEQQWRKAALTLGIDEQINPHLLDDGRPACEQRFDQLVDAMNALNMAKQHLNKGHLSRHIRNRAYTRSNGELRHASRVLAREIKQNADNYQLSNMTLPQHMPTSPYGSTTPTALHHGDNRLRAAPARGTYCENKT